MIQVKDLKLNDANPRFIRDERFSKLKQSIEQFPKMMNLRPIVVDAAGVVLGGNMRLRALIDLGYKSIPGEWVKKASELTEEEKRRFVIADNTGFGEWDWEILANDWDEVELKEWGLELPDEWGQEEPEAQEDGYEVPEEIEVDVKEGDLIEIGRHRLLCGDSVKYEDITRLTNNTLIKIVLADPDFSMNIKDLFLCYENTKKLNPKTSLWICGDKQAASLAVNDFDNFSSFFIHDFRIPTLISNTRAMQRHNMICVFYNCSIINRKDGFSTIIESASERTSSVRKLVPMAKKIDLPAKLIDHFTNKEDVIIDVFMHSGSTMVAAEQLNRTCYGMEIDPKYCQVIIDRMHKAFPELGIKINGETYTPKVKTEE